MIQKLEAVLFNIDNHLKVIAPIVISICDSLNQIKTAVGKIFWPFTLKIVFPVSSYLAMKWGYLHTAYMFLKTHFGSR